VHILGSVGGEAADRAFASVLVRLRTTPDDSLWEWISPHWQQLCAGNETFVRPVLLAVAQDGSVGPFGRSLAMEWLADSYADDAGDDLEEMLDWAASRMTDSSEDEIVAEIAGHVLLDHPRERFRALVTERARSYEAEERAFGLPFGVAEVEHTFDEPRPPPPPRPHFLSFYDPSAIRERQVRWQCEDGGLDDEDLEDDVFGSDWDDAEWLDELPPPPDMPLVLDQPKVGRNDPCPCGSGKKYKKCCMQKT
jgi:hypothetical protein